MAAPTSSTIRSPRESIVSYVRAHVNEPRPPAYDRDSLVSTGVVHIGVGNFHRAHQAMYLDRLLTMGMADTWGICGIGVLESDARMRDVLQAQQGLYTLIERDPQGQERATVIGSIVEYLYAPDDPAAAVAKIAHPETRIVSLTITEGGYEYPPDLAQPWPYDEASSSAQPTGHDVFTLVTLACRRRRLRELDGFTLLSCDNLPMNGDVAKRAFISFAKVADPATAEWMAGNVSFPNSMVDRITPVTTAADIEHVATAFGVLDDWPVCSEAFVQWVVEDNFVSGRPSLEHVGVQFVDDVQPYELMKLRLLNGGHQALAYFALLNGYVFVHEAMSDPSIVSFFVAYLAEARPTLPEVPGIDVQEYCRTLLSRFSNPYVRDTNRRLAENASDRIPKFVLPTIRHRLAAGLSADAGAAVIAAWACCWYRSAHDQSQQALVDARGDALAARVAQLPSHPIDFLRNQAIFGDLADNTEFATAYSAMVALLLELDVNAVLDGITDRVKAGLSADQA